MKTYVKTLVSAGLGISLALVIGATLLSFYSLAEQAEAADSVTHTHVVIEGLATLRTDVLRAENARRGYALTGDLSFVAHFSSAREDLDRNLGAIRMLTADNASQQQRLDELETLIRKRMELLEPSFQRSQASVPDATEASRTLPGLELTSRITALLGTMQQTEQALLRRRDAQAKESAQRTRVVLALGAAATIALIGTVFILLRRQIQHRARAEEDVNRFFNVSADLLCVAGTDGYFKRLNPAWEKVLGFQVSELLAKPYLNFIHPDDAASTRTAALTVERTGIESFENRYRTSDGAYRWLNWKASPDPQRGLIYAAARDVTESKAAQEALEQLNTQLGERAGQLERTNRDLEEFTSSVAHDLRAPLRHVDGFSRILVEEYSAQLGTEGQRLAERVRRATQHMGELVDDLLNLSRVSRREISPLVTDLNPLVGEVIAELQPACQGRHVEFVVGTLPYAECDPGLIRQVYANLISNAVKFTRPRDPAIIEIGQSERNGSRALFVRDNGVGFSMKYADKLFRVFQRLHRSEDFEGTGVGLVTVERIVQKHSGRIWAEAEVDKGGHVLFHPGRARGEAIGRFPSHGGRFACRKLTWKSCWSKTVPRMQS
jgi:PAS domain S-box-containing protein